MTRIKEIQKCVHGILEEMPDKDKRYNAAAHLHGVSLAAVMIARKRGENDELAAIAGLMHDLHAYRSGSYTDHAHLGADLARQLLQQLGVTTEEENDIICSAIWHHDDKGVIDGAMDEVLKDADVIHHTLADPLKPVKPHEQERYEKLCSEFGMK